MDEVGDRKIIQISIGSHSVSDTVFALCNDGTVWGIQTKLSYPKWEKLPAIPQPEEVNALQK